MYHYVGPVEFLKSIDKHLIGRIISSKSDFNQWLIDTKQQIEIYDGITVTFIIDLQHNLRINDRRSEHVVCASGMPVLSAGEMTFIQSKNKILKITQISNQSTGYCPDAKSWPDVEKTLSKLGVDYPDYFTTTFIFRVCNNCNNLNIVKDNYFICTFCDSRLS